MTEELCLFSRYALSTCCEPGAVGSDATGLSVNKIKLGAEHCGMGTKTAVAEKTRDHSGKVWV